MISHFHITKNDNIKHFFVQIVLEKLPQPFTDEFLGDIIYLAF